MLSRHCAFSPTASTSTCACPWERDLEVYRVVPPPVTAMHKPETSIIMTMGGRSSLEHGLPSGTLHHLDHANANERVGSSKAIACAKLPILMKATPKRWLPTLVL